MRILVFDTETTGLPKKRNQSLFNTEDWPYIVQISWVVYDVADSSIVSINDYVIRLPNNITIPEDSINIHGITNEMMLEKGENIKKILRMFLMDCANCNLIVAHNIQFDENIIAVETIRNYGTNVLSQINTRRYCTMKRSIKRFKKYVKLEFLHKTLFNQNLRNLHNSLNDVYVCLRCFIKIYFNKDLLNNKNFVNFENDNVQIFHKSYNELIVN
tara:strand:+ start:27684 stop:28328 length:645 start_codon:yes stop_codon:yes gene_type:complete